NNIKDAKCAMSSYNFDEAAKHCYAVLNNEHASTLNKKEAHSMLAYILTQKGELDEGLIHCKKVLEIEPKNEQANMLLDIILSSANKQEIVDSFIISTVQIGRVFTAIGMILVILWWYKKKRKNKKKL